MILLYFIVFVSFGVTDGVEDGPWSHNMCVGALLCDGTVENCVMCTNSDSLITVTSVGYFKSACQCCPNPQSDCGFDAPSDYTDFIKEQCNDKNRCSEVEITGSDVANQGTCDQGQSLRTDYIRVTFDCYYPDNNSTTPSDVDAATTSSTTNQYATTSASNKNGSFTTASDDDDERQKDSINDSIIGGAVAGALFFIIIITVVCFTMAKYDKPCALPHIKIQIRSPVSFIREKTTSDPVTEQSGCNNPGFTHTPVIKTPSKHFAGAKVVNTPQQAIDMTNMATIEPDILNDIPGRTSAINLPLPDIPPDDDALYSNISVYNDDYNDGSITYNLGYTKINPSLPGPKPAAMFSLDVQVPGPITTVTDKVS